MTKDAVEPKPSLSLAIALLGAKAVAGSQDEDRMATQAQGFRHCLAMILERAGVMRRV